MLHLWNFAFQLTFRTHLDMFESSIFNISLFSVLVFLYYYVLFVLKCIWNGKNMLLPSYLNDVQCFFSVCAGSLQRWGYFPDNFSLQKRMNSSKHWLTSAMQKTCHNSAEDMFYTVKFYCSCYWTNTECVCVYQAAGKCLIEIIRWSACSECVCVWMVTIRIVLHNQLTVPSLIWLPNTWLRGLLCGTHRQHLQNFPVRYRTAACLNECIFHWNSVWWKWHV